MDIVDVERHRRGIVRVVMRHEAARNAMGEVLRGALLQSFTDLMGDPQVRVIIVASGLKDFSVGGDLSRMDELSDPKIGRRRLQSAHRLARILLAADKPLVAEVRGYAMGAGAGLALLCDTIVMADTGCIGFPFARVGLVPDFAIAHTLPHRIGVARARQALLTARNFRAPEALTTGLADDVVGDEGLEALAMVRAEAFAAFPSHVAALTKRMLQHWDDPAAVLDFEAMAQPLCFAADDFKEGLAAFREKRAPAFDPESA